MLKTDYCGDLRASDEGKDVVLAGWVHRRRDHGGLIFIDLRDSRGLVQVVFGPEQAKAHAAASEARGEYVLQVHGRVQRRRPGTENEKMPTGDIEIAATEASILNAAKTPPFYINEESDVDEPLRLKYRYLDLRRERMHNNIVMRHRIIAYIRDFLTERGFIEIETPVLANPTPEGARDYLVPSRVHPGSFYALPQSPQQFKQLLMVAGFERYFQIARCFRDEDLRADRQPEFTQLDLEMSFVEQDDILDLIEELYLGIAAEVRPDLKVPAPFPRMTYAESMRRFGTDKPDLRFGLELTDFTERGARHGVRRVQERRRERRLGRRHLRPRRRLVLPQGDRCANRRGQAARREGPRLDRLSRAARLRDGGTDQVARAQAPGPRTGPRDREAC